MSDKKPNVFPTKEQIEKHTSDRENFEKEKQIVVNEIYHNAINHDDTPKKHVDSVEMMRRRTEEQIRMKKEFGTVIHPELAETQKPRVLNKYEQDVLDIKKKAEAQMKVRDEHLKMNSNQTKNYANQYNAMYNSSIKEEEVKPTPNSPIKQPIMEPQNFGKTPKEFNQHILELSQPNFNSPFDVIPLPSEGKIYGLKKSNVKVSYMTTADENILTSPNLLQSGDFLEILINRKLLETDLRYKNLHIGDRNAIMLWLRATGYGEMYPVTIFDENDQPFDTEINLNDLKYKPLGAEPDSEGLFSFTMPLSKKMVKFKFLTCGDIDAIEEMIEEDKKNDIPLNKSKIYAMTHMIVEIDGVRDRGYIVETINNLRIKDSKDFEKYVEEIESGVDLSITVETPGGGSVNTFLPLNIGFFWPDFGL